MQTFSESAAYVLRFINQTNKSIFLTGKAGTGKTTLLHEILRTTHKNTVVVAPTGIAALNARGVTIHSMFQLPFAAFVPDFKSFPDQNHVRIETKDTLRRHFRLSGTKQAVIRNMELLIIDEVSMLRPDLLDAIEYMLQSVRKNQQPYGGVQVLFIGDLLQLPPVVKSEEWEILRHYYQGKFFFQSHAVLKSPPVYIELSKIFRQDDDKFISILNNLRNNTVSVADLKSLNRFLKPDFDLKKNPGYVTLTTHNAKADAINIQALNELEGEQFSFEAEVTGEFPEKIFPVEHVLNLKPGAQIMFIKNDPSSEKEYYNGKTGIVKSLSAREIYIHFPEENKTIEVEPYEWKNIRYYLDDNTKEIREEVLGTFVHYPIRLAWAITIHKSQGLTFNKAVLDVSQAFLPGQAYVALSRLRSLDGLILLSPLNLNGISNDVEVMSYALNKAGEEKLGEELKTETLRFLHTSLKEYFNWADLLRQWRALRDGFNEDSSSQKTIYHKWATEKLQTIDALLESASKFMFQLDRIFSVQALDGTHLSQRIEAAFSYFFTPLEMIQTEIFWKMEEVRRTKKAKAIFEEFSKIEEAHSKVVTGLMKARQFTEIFVQGREISRENLITNEIRSFRARKIEVIRNDFAAANLALIEDDIADAINPKAKRSKSKLPKKATVDETYELWIQKNSVSEISALRKLTKTTIYGHLGKLITARKIALSDVLPDDKITALAEAFNGYTEETVNGLKEKHGDRFTWEELKLFKASL